MLRSFHSVHQSFQITNKLAAIIAVAMLLSGSIGIVMMLYRYYDLIKEGR